MDTVKKVDGIIARAHKLDWISVSQKIRDEALDLYGEALKICKENEVSPSRMNREELTKIFVDRCMDNYQCERAAPWCEGESLLSRRAYIVWCLGERKEALEGYQEILGRYLNEDTPEEEAFRMQVLVCEQSGMEEGCHLVECWCSWSSIEYQLGRFPAAEEAASFGLKRYPANIDLLCCDWRAKMGAGKPIQDPMECLDQILGEGSWYVNTPWAMACAADLFERIQRYFEAGYLWREFIENFSIETNWSPEVEQARSHLTRLSKLDPRINKLATGEIEEPVSLIV